MAASRLGSFLRQAFFILLMVLLIELMLEGALWVGNKATGGKKFNLLAAGDILLVLGTLIWAMVAIYPYSRWITYIQIPYLLWVSFATVLQLTITYLNR